MKKNLKLSLSTYKIDEIVRYNGYNFRVTGFREPDTLYVKPVGIAKKIYRGEMAVKIMDLEG